MKHLVRILFVPVAAALCLAAIVPSPARAEPAPASLLERQEKVNKVVANASKAVVGISVIGSGVIVSKDGLILSAAHVLDAFIDPRTDKLIKEEVPVNLPDGRIVKAKILGRNRNRDAAMAKITTPGEYDFVELADPNAIKEGDWCIAMGHPGGFQRGRTAPVRLGRVWEKDDKKCFRSDCTVSGGDSGGPLFDLEGRLIGIHSNIGQELTENRHVPIGAFKECWPRLEGGDVWGDMGKLMADRGNRGRQGGESKPEEKPRAQEKPEAREKPMDKPKEKSKESAPASGRASLGVALGSGSEIADVLPGGPADKAGLQNGDIIQALGGDEVEDLGSLVEAVRKYRPNDKVKVKVKRGGETKELEVTLGSKE